MAKTAKLTEKQQRFVEEYLIDLNATQAAIRAGYSAKTADQQGSRMLANVKVQQAISVAMAERSKRTGINQDRVVLELARIAFVKMTDLVDSHGRIKDNATDDDLACIESVKYKQSESETGSSVEREVKISPKLKALELLGKHLGMWNDKLDVNITHPIVITGEDALEYHAVIAYGKEPHFFTICFWVSEVYPVPGRLQGYKVRQEESAAA